MRILLTRTKEQNDKSAARLKALGYEPVCLALGEVIDTGLEFEKLSKAEIILTSPNAAKILHERQIKIDASIYVVGERTKQAVEKYKLGKVLYTAPNANALAKYLLAEFGKTNDPEISLTYFAGEEVAFDFGVYFNSKTAGANVLIDKYEVYKIVRLVPSESVLIDSVASCANGVQLHYSAASADYFFMLIRKYKLERACKNMHAIVISDKTSHSVDFSLVKSVQNAKIETEGSMFELIQNTTQT